MSGQALGPQFHYHTSDPEFRESIRKQGLRAQDASQSYALPGRDPEVGYQGKAVYMTPERKDFFTNTELKHGPSRFGGDVWRVNTAGLKLHPDPEAAIKVDAHQPSVFSKKSVGPERLKLVRRGNA